MPNGTSSHLHIVHSTDDEEIIRVSGPLTADAARREFDLGYPEEFEAVLDGGRQWEVAEHGADQWTSIGWCPRPAPTRPASKKIRPRSAP